VASSVYSTQWKRLTKPPTNRIWCWFARAQRLTSVSFWSPPRGGFTNDSTIHQTNRPFQIGRKTSATIAYKNPSYPRDTSQRISFKQPESARLTRRLSIHRAIRLTAQSSLFSLRSNLRTPRLGFTISTRSIRFAIEYLASTFTNTQFTSTIIVINTATTSIVSKPIKFTTKTTTSTYSQDDDAFDASARRASRSNL